MGQRAGFIGADNVRAAQGFHRGEFLNQRVAFCHALGAHGERQRDSWQHAFRHKSDHHTQREDEAVQERNVYHQAGGNEEDKTDAHGDDCDNLGRVFHLFLERAEFLFQGLGHLGDVSEVGVHPGRVNDGFARAGCHEGAREYQVRNIRAGHILTADRFCRAIYRVGFSGQRGLVHA